MKITCQSCGAKYAIADEKVLGRKVKVRCKTCSTAIVVDGTQPAEAAYGEGEDDEATRIVQGPPSFGDDPAEGAWSVNLSDTDQRNMTTDEIVSGWHSGLVSEEAFVWKDGMADWAPVLEVNELYDAISAASQQPPPAEQTAPAAPVPDAFGAPAGPAFGPSGGAAAEARLSGGRAQGGADLFGSVADAGSEHDPSLDAPAAPAQHAYDAKPTGARNENSVLFSLDALKAGFGSSAPEQKAPAPQRREAGGKANLDDLMGMGGGGGNPLFGMGTNQALLTAPAPPEPPPPPPPKSVPPAAAGQFPSVAPPPARANKALIAIAGGAIVLVLILGGALALALGHKKGKEVAENDPKTAASSHLATDKPKDKADKTDEKKDEAKTDKKDEATASDAGAAEGDAGTDEAADRKFASPEEKKRFFEAMKKKKEEAAKKKDEPAAPPPEKHEVSASFNKGAAISALTSAASAASGCKRPGGPTGRGRAIVTFAPSGRVTSANVTGGSFGGTSVGGCVASVFRHAHIPPFSGNAVTVAKSFTIPD